MFCPVCKTEYREGFMRCSDCGAALVATLPPGEPAEWPRETTKQSHFLAWFLPMLGFYALAIFIMSAGHLIDWPYLEPLAVLFMLYMFVAQFGTFWMLYQSIRYERHSVRYCLLSLVPFMFAWYYFERYRRRAGQDRIPVAFR